MWEQPHNIIISTHVGYVDPQHNNIYTCVPCGHSASLHNSRSANVHLLLNPHVVKFCLIATWLHKTHFTTRWIRGDRLMDG